MIDLSRVFALDGHDGSGKSTLAQELVIRLGGVCQRPFHGPRGDDLLAAWRRGDAARVIALGEQSIVDAIGAAGDGRPVILDRGWMTVASLVDWERFLSSWRMWIPTVLCWADLSTTQRRLGGRCEPREAEATHVHFLEVYRKIAERTGTPIVPTAEWSIERCQSFLMDWQATPPSSPGFPAR